MKFINFASSSDGNCTLISDEKVNILVDCGIRFLHIKENLDKYNLSLNDINAILITHEHSDHTLGLEVTLKNNPNIQVFGLKETLSSIYLKNENFYSKMNFNTISCSKILKHEFLKDSNMIIVPYESHHDVPCCFYKFIIDKTKFAILTDCGYVNQKIIDNICDVNYLMLESNYDEDLIYDSPYPQELIKRIKGKGGHLSNRNCADTILQIHNNNLKTICLSHISDKTNNEENALIKVKEHLFTYMNDVNQIPNIIVASRNHPTIIFDK